MENEIYQSEPNLLAEAYRNQSGFDMPRQIERHFDFLEINKEGTFMLGTSNLTGRIWSGSIWLLKEFTSEPTVENCLSGIEFESSIATGLWVDEGTTVIVGCDSGSLHHLTLVSQIGSKEKQHFRIDGIATEHDDSIVTLDLMKNKTKIISGGMDMNIKIWDEAALLCEKSYCPAHGHIVTSVSSQINHCDIFASTSLDGTSLLWDTRVERPASLIMKNDFGYTASSWVDDTCITLGSNDGKVSLVDSRMKQELCYYSCAQRPIFKLKYNLESNLLAVCADDPIVRVLSVRDKSLANLFESEKHVDFVRGLAWDSSSNVLYSCGWDSKLHSHPVTTKNLDRNGTDCKQEQSCWSPD